MEPAGVGAVERTPTQMSRTMRMGKTWSNQRTTTPTTPTRIQTVVVAKADGYNLGRWRATAGAVRPETRRRGTTCSVWIQRHAHTACTSPPYPESRIELRRSASPNARPTDAYFQIE
jgi:hypothetical protein